ncbi:hypothetical protein [Alkaliphilus oremlandii]|uniref:Uncharacterized protein n=1 Tax=Alkaliphilus oremlandii (strain OhILAs) TaxID=350688 RepID=A8MIY4_ALKOO|nr:hypothetical protein [Alkaliphilus oremlandii]ABW19766.1 hypothetical protein Clos_2231 [Alkaliphilus oremlandii OhILAs]
MKKRFLMLGLSTALILSSSLSTFALVPENKLLDVNNQENIISDFSEINDNETVVSDVLSFDEIVELMSKNNNISKQEAENRVIKNFYESRKSLLNTSTSITPYNATYRTVSSSFTVTNVYKPSVFFYCETSEGGSFWGIVRIIHVDMDRNYNGMSKQFGGSVFVHLENAGRIYWIVNGDFTNNGTTSGGVDVDFKIGESGSVGFNLSGSTDHYEYVRVSGYYNVR